MTPSDTPPSFVPQPLPPGAQPADLLVPTGPADILTLQAEVRASVASVASAVSVAPVAFATGASRVGAVSAGLAPALDPLRSHLREVDPGTLGAFVRWPVSVRTLGADRGFLFETAEVTPHGVYVHCEDFSRTPFRAGATIVQVSLQVPRVLVQGEGTPADFVAFTFLAKITRAIGAKAALEALPQIPGFVLSVIQIDFEESAILAETLARLRTQDEIGA